MFRKWFWIVEKLFSDNLLASLTKLVAAAKLKKIMKKYITFTTNRLAMINLTGFKWEFAYIG